MVKYGAAERVPAEECHRHHLPLSTCRLLYPDLILGTSLGAWAGDKGPGPSKHPMLWSSGQVLGLELLSWLFMLSGLC